MDFWQFLGSYWWLAFPIMGVAGGLARRWEFGARARHKRRLEILQAKAALKAAQPPKQVASASEPRPLTKDGYALLERIGILQLVLVDLGVQLLQHLGGDVVVERGGGIREQQPGAGRRRPADHEKVVIDVEQTEYRSGAS